jgi:PPM family protein phosphatase
MIMSIKSIDKLKFTESSNNFFISSSLSAAGLTDRGIKRENNEDAFYIDRNGLFIVSDGMGGEKAGEVASRMVVEHLPARIISAGNSSSSEAILKNSIIYVSNYIMTYTQARDELKGAGATVVACLIENDKAIIGHMGDSRAYLLRNSKFKQITEDHSIVFDMVKMGFMTLSEAKKDPLRNRITRCMGMTDTPVVDIRTVELLCNDKLLLCTDGLTEMLSDEVIGQHLLHKEDLLITCKKLINSANFAGGTDNITAVIIQYGKNEKEQNNIVHSKTKNFFINLSRKIFG